jgi:hypothetical protein
MEEVLLRLLAKNKLILIMAPSSMEEQIRGPYDI